MTAPEDHEPLLGLGAFIRAQRRLANLSLRQLADLAEVSNPYLSQVERGLHAPSVRVLRSVAQALNVSTGTLLRQAGLVDDGNEDSGDDTESAIRSDGRLTEPQKSALLGVYRSYLDANQRQGRDR